MEIANKKDMYALYEKGYFGNKLQTWATLDDFLQDRVEKNVVMRYKGTQVGKWIAYDLSPAEVPSVVDQWLSEGVTRDLITLNESAPDDLLLIQGEVMNSTHHFSMRYSDLPLPMCKALATKQFHADGYKAQRILQYYMDCYSYDDLKCLLEHYPDSVVEFSIWGKNVGNLCQNTVFWEVRNY